MLYTDLVTVHTIFFSLPDCIVAGGKTAVVLVVATTLPCIRVQCCTIMTIGAYDSKTLVKEYP